VQKKQTKKGIDTLLFVLWNTLGHLPVELFVDVGANTRTHMTEQLAHEDGITVQGEYIAPGAEILIKGKRGRFRFKHATVTPAGRVVVNTIGPVGMHQAFRNFYIEDVKLVPKPKKRRRRRVV
jgi:hypothetical protein